MGLTFPLFYRILPFHMRISWSDPKQRYEAESSYQEKDALSKAKWTWDREDRLWWTNKHVAASKLAAFFDASAKKAFLSRSSTEKRQLESQQYLETLSHADSHEARFTPPPGLEYLPYQQAGIAYFISAYERFPSLGGVCIADDMGLGKSIQAIGIINHATWNNQQIKSVLIICPATLKINWARHCRDWLLRPFTIRIATPQEPFGPSTPWHDGGDPSLTVTIVNYDIAGRGNYDGHDLLIMDEAHALKNPEAKRTIAILGRTGSPKRQQPPLPGIRARQRLFLTGTPICNRPKELWTIAHACAPTFIPSTFFAYARRYCDAHQGAFGWDFSGASNLGELQQLIRGTFMCRRLKRDVLKQLPPKRRQVIEFPQSGETAKIVADERGFLASLDVARREVRAKIAETKARHDTEGYNAAVARLREIDGVSFRDMSALRKRMAVAKVPHVIAYLDDLLDGSDEKIIVFAHHKAVVDALMAHFGAGAVKVTGDVAKVEDRMAAVDRFQTDPTCRLFIGNILAAGVGLTLTASATVVFAELDFVPGNVTQAEDRAVRIGQEADMVNVYHLVVDGSIDAKMAKMIIAKQAVIDRALNRSEQVSDGDFADTGDNGNVVNVLAEIAEVERQLNQEQTAHAPNENREDVPHDVPCEDVPKKSHAPVMPESPQGDKGTQLSEANILAIHQALRILRDRCDGAMSKDGSGFNRFHADFGRKLADAERLTLRMAEHGQRLVKFYRRQLNPDLLIACGISPKTGHGEVEGRERGGRL